MLLNPPPNQSPFLITNERLPNVWQSWFTLLWRKLKDALGFCTGQGVYSRLSDFAITTTPQAVPFDTNELQYGSILHSTTTNTTRFVATLNGYYTLFFQPQVAKVGGGGSSYCHFWVAKNSVAIDNSAMIIRLSSNNQNLVVPLSIIVDLSAGDYVELFTVADSNGAYALDYQAASGGVPVCPAIIAQITATSK